MATPDIYATKATQSAPYDATQWNTQDANQVKAYLEYLEAKTSSLGYKSYIALLSVSGVTITPTVIYNSLGDGSGDGINDIQWQEIYSNGVLEAQMTSSLLTAKTISFVGGVANYTNQVRCVDNGYLTIQLYYHDGTQTGTPSFSGMSVEIRVYD